MTISEKPRFPILSVAEAHMRHALLAALNGRRAGTLLLRATIASPPPCSGVSAQEGGQESPDWFRCAEDIAFRLRHVDGQPVRTDAADGPAMAALLDAANALLAEVEAALGLTLDPADISPRPPAAALIARITLHDDAILAAEMDIALSANTPILPMPAPFAPALLGHIPLPARLLLDGPRLSPADAAALAPGDLLLIGAAPLMAGVGLPGAPAVPGRIMPAERLFRSLN